MITFFELLNQTPSSWGLRGDPYLWKEIQKLLADVSVPSEDERLRNIIEDAFYTITGKHISQDENFYVEKFAHGGMSSGYISPQFWNTRAIAFMCKLKNEI